MHDASTQNPTSASTDEIPRVVATAAALELLDTIRARHGPVLFHQSGGCCDGSSPMCYPQDEFTLGESDRWIGNIGGADFHMSASQFEYWQHTQLIIDAVAGRGGMFSLDNGTGKRFLTRSRLFEAHETPRLVEPRNCG